MKRILTLFLLVVMCLGVCSLAGCQLTPGTGTTPTTTEPTTPPVDVMAQAKVLVRELYKDSAVAPKKDYTLVSQIVVAGETYPVTWSVDTDLITISEEPVDGFYVVDLPASNETEVAYVLTATITVGEAQGTVTFERTLPLINYTAVIEPEENVAYKLFFDSATLNQMLYAKASTVSGNKYIDTTNDPKAAPDYFAEKVDGGYKFYTTDANGNKLYVNPNLQAASDGHWSKYLGLAESTDAVFTYNADKAAWVVTLEGTEYYMGTYNTYNTFSISESSHLPSDTSFPGGFLTKADAEALAPDAPPAVEIPTLEGATKPEAGKAYLVGMAKGDKVYYLTGAMNGYYMATVTATDTAVNFYVEEVSGGYNLYAMVNGSKLYVNAVVSGSYVNGKYQEAASTVWTWNDTLKTLETQVNNTAYILGTGYLGTYTTIGPVKAADDNNYIQFVISNKADSTDPVDPPVGPTLDAVKPEVGKTYLAGMIKDANVYYINGAMDGYYMATVTTTDSAVLFGVEETDGGFYLFCTIDGAKKYVNIVASGTYRNNKFEDAATSVWTWNESLKTLETSVEGTAYVLGTDATKTYTTVAARKADSNSNIIQFALTAGGQDPVDPPVGPTLDAVKPEAGKTYLAGMIKDANIYYINGVMDGYYMATVTTTDGAVLFGVEETDGGFYLFCTIDGAKKYVNIVASGTYRNNKFEDAATSVWTWNESLKTLETSVEGTAYVLGTDAAKTYTTVAARKADSNSNIIQFALTAGGQDPVDPPVVPPVEPTIPGIETAVKPETGKKYLAAMLKADKIYYVDGTMANTYYFGTTETVASGINFYVEETDGGFYLYAIIQGAKKYINVTTSGTHVNCNFQDTAATVWTWNETRYTLQADVNGTAYIMGTDAAKTYTTLGMVKADADVEYAQFVVSTNPDQEAPVTPPAPPAGETTTYSYTFVKGVYTANNSTANLGGINWAFAGTAKATEYFGYDTNNNPSKGFQFGSGNNPWTALTLTSDSLNDVTKIVINTSGASSIAGTLTVSVGGTEVKTITLTKTATVYTIELTEALDGEVVLSYSQTSSKAIYISSIEITYTPAN